MIRFAVIGTNTITDKFLQAASALPDFKLCAVYSRTLARAQEYAQKNNVSLVFDSLEALADSDQIDAVYIASPNFCHAAQSILMMQHHKHVLCEKPIASNASEFQQMYDTAIKNQVILLEAMRSVFSPGFAAIRSLLPVLGTIRQVDFSFCKYSSRYDHFKEGIIENAFHPALSNAALMDIGVYCVHPLVSLFGMPASIQSSSIFLSNGFEGAGTVLLQYPDMQATLRYSKISDSYLPSQIQGEAATLLIDKIQDPQQLTLLFRDGHTENPNIPAVSNNMVYEAAEFVRLIDQLQQALENDSTDGIPSLIRPQATKNSFSGRPLRSAVFIPERAFSTISGGKMYLSFYIEIHPNAFATELIKMIVAKIGHKYRIITLKIFFLRNALSPCITSSSMLFVPTTFDTSRQVAIAAIGIITEFVRKSKKSRNCIPISFTQDNGPYPIQDKVPRPSMITPTKTTAFLRPQ